MRKNKKGASLDFLLLIFALLILSMITIVATFVYEKMATDFPQDEALVEDVITQGSALADSMKYMLLIVIMGSGLVIFIVSVIIPSNPLFAIAGFILFLLSIIAAVFANNIFDEFVTSNADLEAHVMKEYSPIRSIFNSYPYYALIMCGLALIGLTAKRVIYGSRGAG